MPTQERHGTDDREDLEDRRKPSIQLDKEPAIVIPEPDPALHLTSQNDQLMSENRILRVKPAFRLEWQGQNRKDEKQQPDHPASLPDSVTSPTQIRFSVHTDVSTNFWSGRTPVGRRSSSNVRASQRADAGNH